MKVGDIVRMKPNQGWIPEVVEYVGRPLVVHEILEPESPVSMLTLSLRLLNETKPLCDPESKDPWRFIKKNLVLDEFCAAVRKAKESQ